MDCSLPGSSIPGVLQARILEWVAISFSRGSSRSRDWTWVSCIAGRCFTLWAFKELSKVILKSRHVNQTFFKKTKLQIYFFSEVNGKNWVKSQPWQLSCRSLDFGPYVCSLFQPLPHPHDTQAALLGNGSCQLLCVTSGSLDEHTPVLPSSPAVKLPYPL